MRSLKTPVLMLALTLLFPVLVLAEIHHADSLDTIEQRNTGVPWLLVIWSTDCPPCHIELELLSGLQKRQGEKLRVEFFSFDALRNEDDVLRIANSHQLDTWFSTEPNRQKLQMMIDSNWRGELPRSYWYQADGSRCAQSGVLSKQAVIAWFEKALPSCQEPG